MTKVRVSVTLPAEVRDRLAGDANARGQSISSLLGSMLSSSRPASTAAEWEEVIQARTEARTRSRELGEARREIRQLKVRLNSLLAGSDGAPARTPPWSLDPGRRTRDEVDAWWRSLASGVERLRVRYGLVSQVFDSSSGGDRTREYWWESAGRVRAIAIAVAWEEMLDAGGDSVPVDPRFAEGFLDYLWRISHRERAVVPVGQFWDSWGEESLAKWREAERSALEEHIGRERGGMASEEGCHAGPGWLGSADEEEPGNDTDTVTEGERPWVD